MTRIDFDTKLAYVVGEKSARALETAFGHRLVGDLVRHYPRRHVERGKLTDIGALVPDELVTIMARVGQRSHHRFGPGGRKWRSTMLVTDGTASLELTFFNAKWRIEKLADGALGLFSGKVTEYRGRLQLTHPDFQILDDETLADFSSLIPLYPATAKVTSWRIAQSVEIVLDALTDVVDPVPPDLAIDLGLWSHRAALEGYHRPRNLDDVRRAEHRLKFDEAFVIQGALAQRRLGARVLHATPRQRRDGGARQAFVERLPFSLTAGQSRVAETIESDLAASHPMHRMLQGEVGSGKTIVALLGMLQTVDAGAQAALLAPTEVLAQQHFRSFSELVGDLVSVRLLTGSQPTAERKAALLDVQTGEADLVVGTHALLSETVGFWDLGLVVVDEQHRFGVEQRAALTQKAETRAHVLVMTATPIPRTVAMMAFGDLDISVLDELPAGRQPISTTVVPVADQPAWFARVWERVREEVAAGGQAYVVCPRIGDGAEDDPADAFGVLATGERLIEGPLADLRVGLLHGRMAPADKDAAMAAFSRGEIDVLVATTVVEVGVDVPNATVMAILDADRFGVAQLHQLRGRVGRGAKPGLCLLVHRVDGASPAAERLAAVASTTDGFALSRLDIELRREGDVLGADQSGYRSSLRFLSVLRDEEIIQQARDAVEPLVEADPVLVSHPDLHAAIRTLENAADYLEKT